MQNNDNLITLSIIRSLQDMELESFKVYAQQRHHFEQNGISVMLVILYLVKSPTMSVNPDIITILM